MSERTQTNDRSASSTETGANGGNGANDGQPSEQRSSSRMGAIADRFTETFVRLTVAVIGIVLLLLGLSQIVGVDLYSIVGAILSSRVGQWLLVAIFGLGLIVAAGKRWTPVGERT